MQPLPKILLSALKDIPNNTSEEHLQTLFDCGFTRVSYGVQDYNPTVQLAIHRLQPFVNVKRVTEKARRNWLYFRRARHYFRSSFSEKGTRYPHH